ncbi:MAG: mechanosensitive ion channel domain-containing protein [archaeon]
MNESPARASNKSLFVVGGILLAIVLGCAAWFSCREYCVTYFYTNYALILAKTFLYARKLVIILLLFIIFKILQRFLLEKLIRSIAIKTKISNNYEGVLKLLRFGLWVVFSLIVLAILIGNFTTIFASLGLFAFGLTFALQKPILNFVGWLTIISKRMYVEGDRIKVGAVVGDVVDIQVMNTILDGILDNSNVSSGKKVILPNELILSTDVQNYTMDSNYIVQELLISITYESNYHEAIKILKNIIREQIAKNKSKYVDKMIKNQQTVDKFIKQLLSKKNVTVDKLKKDVELEKLNEEKEHIEQMIDELGERFQPKIRVEMLDSAIQLIGQFKCPYDEIKKYRTAINLKFMDVINERDDISIAYPHMQLVQTDKTKKK